MASVLVILYFSAIFFHMLQSSYSAVLPSIKDDHPCNSSDPNCINPCNSSDPNCINPCNSSVPLKILSFPWPQDVEAEGNVTSIDDPLSTLRQLRRLRGFSVDVLDDFLRHCPRDVDLRLINYESHYTYEYVVGLDFDVILNQFEASTVWLRSGLLYSQPSYVTSVALIYDPMAAANIGGSGSVLTGFLAPNVRLALLAFSLLGAVVFGIIAAAERARIGVNGGDRPMIATLAWNLLCATIGAADPGAFRGTAWRLLAISWTLFWFIVATMFSSHVSSTMTIDKIRHPIRTLDDLARSDREFFWNDYMMRTNHPTFVELRRRYAAFETPLMRQARKLDKAAAAELLSRGKIMVTNWLSFLGEVEVAGKACGYTILKDESMPVTFHFIFNNRERSLLEKFNLRLEERKESGMLREWQDQWFDGVCKNGEPSDRGASVEWRHIDVAFVAAAVGVAAAAVLAIIQFIFARKKSNARGRIYPEFFQGRCHCISIIDLSDYVN